MMTQLLTYPEAPGRKLHRYYMRCHSCHSSSVYYSTKRCDCICDNCKKSFDPDAVATNNRLALHEMARRIIIRGCEE